MAELRIDFLPVVSGGHLKDAINLRHVQQINGVHFWRAIKSDPLVTRLLLGKSSPSERPLALTDVIEQLQALRNAAVDAIANPVAKEDLNLDDESTSTKRRRGQKGLHDLPPMVSVTAPTIGEVIGLQMKVLPHQGPHALWLELKPDIISYLSMASKYQIDHEVVAKKGKPKHKESHCDAGVSFESRRQAYRAKGPKGCKYFKVSDYVDAKGEANTWLQASQELETMP